MAGFIWIDGYGLLDAVYMVVVTLTTVGFRPVKEMSPAGMIFDIVFVTLGVVSVLFVLGRAVGLIFDGHLHGEARRHRMKKIISDMKDHYIVCSFGRVGQKIAQDLREAKVEFVVIDLRPDMREMLESLNIPHVIGTVSSDEILEAAGIKRAKGLIAAADSDTENVYVTLAARVLNPNIYIMARAGHRESEEKLKRAGANETVSPYYIAGLQMARTVLQLENIHV